MREARKGLKPAPVVVWDSERITISADEALQAAKGGSAAASKAQAVTWLKTVLNNGEREGNAVIREGKAAGFTDNILRSAKEELGILSRKGIGSATAGWFWRLPDIKPETGQEEKLF